ncbi:MAG: selenide, water dikinase SelD [Pseudomonadota bacterium]
MTPAFPLTRELVLIGGGHTHALVLRRWGMAPLPGARLTLINPGPTAPYTGMLPGFVAGHYARDSLEIDLVRLARFAGARLILGKAEGIDRAAKRIQISGHGDIAYDIASIDIGITSDLPGLPGFLEYGMPAKPLGAFAAAWERFCARNGPAAIAIIGAGVGGVELALAMAHAMAAAGRLADITVIDRGRALDRTHPPARIALLEALRAQGIRLLEDADIVEVTADAVHLARGRRIPADLSVGVAGARPYRWLSTTGLDLRDGFIEVDASLRSSDPAIFAAGDCAYFASAPRPKAGVFAVRAAPTLTHNLRADLTGSARRAFRPQEDYLKLISLGGQTALAEKWGLTAQGAWVWRWKDRIDRAFMDRLADLPPMARPVPPPEAAQGVRAALGTQQPCGGCGAKVAPATLFGAVAALDLPKTREIEYGPGDDAAVLKIGGARQVISTDHLRALTGDPYLMARIALNHAIGDIWAMGATPQAALATIILPQLSPEMQAAWLDEIMAGTARALEETGAALAGGHTTVGAELTLGFTVTGRLDRAPITLAGARPGDALVLTRPIGSGVILAAEMMMKARGADVAGCLEEMARPQGAAAHALLGARAMTDVTGFGLAGHLLAMCQASNVAAELRLADLPLFPGAQALAAAGVRSTLFAANKTHAPIAGAEDARADLLYDPQTAGGLLAAVPEGEVSGVLAALDASGSGHLIGRIVEGPADIRLA